jgi:hypothetical protein
VLVAIGADQPVTFAGRDLPAFAKLEGALLTLAPQRNDAGDYALTLTANAGRESASGDLRVHVLRFNTAPTWSPSTLLRVGSLSQSFGDSVSGLGARYPCPDPTFCTAASDPYVALRACDAEGDGIVVELEVVPRGRPFENKPTFSASAPPVYPPPASGNCPAVLVHMPGLIPGQSYEYAVRVRDELGAVGGVAGAPDGWYVNPQLGFDQGPCTTSQCAGYGTAEGCWVDLDCRSGVCDTSVPPSYGFWQCK